MVTVCRAGEFLSPEDRIGILRDGTPPISSSRTIIDRRLSGPVVGSAPERSVGLTGSRPARLKAVSDRLLTTTLCPLIHIYWTCICAGSTDPAFIPVATSRISAPLKCPPLLKFGDTPR